MSKVKLCTTTFTCDRCDEAVVLEYDTDEFPRDWAVIDVFKESSQMLCCDECLGKIAAFIQVEEGR